MSDSEAEENSAFDDLKFIIKSYIFCAGSKCNDRDIRNEYFRENGKRLDDVLRNEFGMTFYDFLKKISDVCKVSQVNGELIIERISNQDTSHLDELKRGEKKTRKKKPTRFTGFRPFSSFNGNRNLNYNRHVTMNNREIKPWNNYRTASNISLAQPRINFYPTINNQTTTHNNRPIHSSDKFSLAQPRVNFYPEQSVDHTNPVYSTISNSSNTSLNLEQPASIARTEEKPQLSHEVQFKSFNLSSSVSSKVPQMNDILKPSSSAGNKNTGYVREDISVHKKIASSQNMHTSSSYNKSLNLTQSTDIIKREETPHVCHEKYQSLSPSSSVSPKVPHMIDILKLRTSENNKENGFAKKDVFQLDTMDTWDRPPSPSWTLCDSSLTEYATEILRIPNSRFIVENKWKLIKVKLLQVSSPTNFTFQFNLPMLDRIMKEMEEHYSANDYRKDLQLSTVLPGMSVVVHHNNQWFRAEVLYINDSNVCVKLVDFDGVINVNPEKLRYLKKSFCCASKMSSIGSLFNVKPKNGSTSWDARSVEVFKKITENADVFAVIERVTDDRVGLTLYLNSSLKQSIANKMILQDVCSFMPTGVGQL